MKKFDHIIMNPPYCKNLHLKILNEAIKHSDDVVNLSPIRWLQDPLAEYKKNSDFKKFKDIRDHIDSLEVISAIEAEQLFNIGLPFNIGIYHITSTGHWNNVFKKPLVDKFMKKIIDTNGSLKQHITIDDLDGICVLLSAFTGGNNGRLLMETPFMLKKDKAYFTNKLNDFTHETYLEQRTRLAWGNVKPKSENTNIKFNSVNERESFYNSWSTKPLRWLFNNTKVDVNVRFEFLPYLEDYTHPWTDEMLYKYFELTPEEIQTIENEFKDEGTA